MISSQPIPIVEFFYDYKTTTRQQHMKFERRIHKTPQILFEMNGMEVRLFDRQRLYSPEEIEWTIPYNPIELEWNRMDPGYPTIIRCGFAGRGK